MTSPASQSASPLQHPQPSSSSSFILRFQSESGSHSSSQDSPEALPDGGQTQTDAGNKPPTKRRRGRARPGACVHCKSLKVRCEFSAGETKCQRCVAGNHDCLSRDRKKRKPAPTHEDLQARSKEQDEQLSSILQHFDHLRLESKIDGWVRRAEASIRINEDGEIARPVPVLTCHYYSALIGPLHIDVSTQNPDYARLPIIMRAKIVDAPEVLDLFNLFFERINPFFSLLDGELHCPQKLVYTSPFLFTVICAIACRHYSQRPGLFDLLMEISRDAAGDALVSGPKTVETVQAFLLLAVYPVPKKKWLDDRSWLYMGTAIRLAQELQLDQAPDGPDQQLNSNVIRTWMNCFCVDGSHATQFGKMAMVKLDDFLVRTTARVWYKSPSSGPYDIGLCGYAELLLLMARFRKVCGVSGFASDGKEIDLAAAATEYDKQFASLHAHWNDELGADPNVAICPVVRYRFHNFSLIAAYLRLVVLSQGFQYSVRRGVTRHSYILQQSIEMAQLALTTVIHKLFPSSLLGWAMEANFLYMAFCAGFLLNLLRPKFLPLLAPQQSATIVRLVERLIEILSSEDVALDGKHSPAVYAKFLSTLLQKYYTPSLQQDVKSASSEIMPQYQPTREQSPPFSYSWPDTPSIVGTPEDDHMSAEDLPEGSYTEHVVRQLAGEAEMDFSLQHFVRSTISVPLPPPDPMGGTGIPFYPPLQEAPQQWYTQGSASDDLLHFYR